MPKTRVGPVVAVMIRGVRSIGQRPACVSSGRETEIFAGRGLETMAGETRGTKSSGKGDGDG